MPPKLPNTSSRLIALAVSLVGSAQAVSTEMRCSDEAFLDYCAGKKEPSWPELDRLVGLIVREQGKADRQEPRAAQPDALAQDPARAGLGVPR